MEHYTAIQMDAIMAARRVMAKNPPPPLTDAQIAEIRVILGLDERQDVA